MIEKNNLLELEQAVEYLIVNSEKRRELSLNAYEQSSKYSLEEVCELWIDLIGSN